MKTSKMTRFVSNSQKNNCYTISLRDDFIVIIGMEISTMKRRHFLEFIEILGGQSFFGYTHEQMSFIFLKRKSSLLVAGMSGDFFFFYILSERIFYT